MSERLNSYEALKEKRDALKKAVAEAGKTVEIRVALGTCAMATGAKDVYDVIKDAVKENNLTNVEIKPTGCMGYCYAEPTVEVVGVAAEPGTGGCSHRNLPCECIRR